MPQLTIEELDFLYRYLTATFESAVFFSALDDEAEDGNRAKQARAKTQIETLLDKLDLLADHERPTIVCLCGSARFSKSFRDARLRETLGGRIVLTIASDCAIGNVEAVVDDFDSAKLRLDELHKRKIDLADEILVLNVGGYVGESTRGEIEYARANNKRIRFLEPEPQLAA